MKQRVTVNLEADEVDALQGLSIAQRRDPRDLAALLIRQRLLALGQLTPTAGDAAVRDDEEMPNAYPTR